MSDYVGGVVDEIDPRKEGWKFVYGKVWRKPDGELFEFAPWMPEKLIRFRGIRRGEILRENWTSRE